MSIQALESKNNAVVLSAVRLPWKSGIIKRNIIPSLTFALFDGINDMITIPAHEDFVFGTNAYAIIARGVSFDYTSTSTYHHIFTVGDHYNFGLKAWEGNSLYFYNGGTRVQWSGLRRDVAVDVALVRYGTGLNQTKLYINGILVDEGTDSKNYTSYLNPKIGNGWLSEYTKGAIGCIRVYKGTVPTEDDIIRSKYIPMSNSGLVALYDFKGDSPFDDKSGNGHHGTGLGGIRTSDD